MFFKLHDCRISSPELDITGDVCIEFAYHMYGSTIGKLAVYVNYLDGPDPASKLIFEATGTQGNLWLMVRLTIMFTGQTTVSDGKIAFLFDIKRAVLLTTICHTDIKPPQFNSMSTVIL